MRPIIRLLAAAVAAAATIPSCSTLTGYPTDAEASYAKAIELTKKSVDTDKFKIYSLSIMEGETLSDNLFLVTVKLVNKDDQAFSQSYYMNGLEPTDLRDVQSTFEAPEYETTVGIDLSERSMDAFENSVLLSILGECALAVENRRIALEKEQATVHAQNEQLRANLLRTISHDLRTPLTSISGNASNLLSNAETLDAETRTKICTDIFDDAQWLIGLVENLLSITRIEDGRMNLQISPQLMDEVVEEALRHISRKSKEHIITTTYSDEILLADMDARLIMQVIINLVDNAIKYTQKGSRINISAYAKNSNIVVDVSDDGPGIPEQNKAQVFEMFFTGQNQIADSHRSLGLGLALCRTILAAHKGTLTLRDNEPHGCIFSFELPKSEVSIHE